MKTTRASIDLKEAERTIKKAKVQYNVGDHMYFQHAPETPFTIVSTSGTPLSHEDDAELIRNMHKINYAFEHSQTWVFAPVDPTARNPKLSAGKLNLRSGDGEIMQVRGVVTISKHGIYRFYRFSKEAEWRAIKAKSGLSQEDVILRANRTADTKHATSTNKRPEVCVISDDLYYDPDACDARLKWISQKLREKGDTTTIPKYIMYGDPDYETVIEIQPAPQVAMQAEEPPAPPNPVMDIEMVLTKEAILAEKIRSFFASEDQATLYKVVGKAVVTGFRPKFT